MDFLFSNYPPMKTGNKNIRGGVLQPAPENFKIRYCRRLCVCRFID